MDEKEKREEERPEDKRQEEEMPFCTKAPSAEHARGSDEEEPCDDYRGAR